MPALWASDDVIITYTCINIYMYASHLEIGPPDVVLCPSTNDACLLFLLRLCHCQHVLEASLLEGWAGIVVIVIHHRPCVKFRKFEEEGGANRKEQSPLHPTLPPLS